MIREWQLNTHQLGRRVLVYDMTDSTSTRCAAFAGDAGNHGLAVLAHAQTAGRGQHGRHWQCEPGMGVLFSVLLFPPARLSRPAILTAWAAVSVCELIQELTGLEARIKWPNDVLIGGRKVCGILIEQNRGVVAGLGLNLNQSQQSFLDADLPEAGSLHAFTGQTYDAEEVAQHLLTHLDARYQQLITGHLPELEQCWQARLGLLGQEVEVESHQANCTGRLLELSFDGVLLQRSCGESLLLAPEQIKHISLVPRSGPGP